MRAYIFTECSRVCGFTGAKGGREREREYIVLSFSVLTILTDFSCSNGFSNAHTSHRLRENEKDRRGYIDVFSAPFDCLRSFAMTVVVVKKRFSVRLSRRTKGIKKERKGGRITYRIAVECARDFRVRNLSVGWVNITSPSSFHIMVFLRRFSDVYAHAVAAGIS